MTSPNKHMAKVPVCSTESSPVVPPSRPTQKAAISSSSELEQVTEGSTHEAETLVKVPLVASYPAQFCESPAATNRSGVWITPTVGDPAVTAGWAKSATGDKAVATANLRNDLFNDISVPSFPFALDGGGLTL